MDSIEIGQPRDEEELKAHRKQTQYSFSDNPPTGEPNVERSLRRGLENYLVARLHWVVIGGLGIDPVGQWFGGRCVPMAGIGGVTIVPEYRSTGVGSRLMRELLEQLHDRGLYLSTLYPATQPVYRRAGYEQAGVYMQYRQPAHGLDIRERGLAMRPAGEADEPTLRELYRERARRTSGNVERPDHWWSYILESQDVVVNTYLVEDAGQAEGYIVYTQETRPGSDDRNMVLRDLVALTPGALRRILTFFTDHRSVIDNVIWAGSPSDPVFLYITNQNYKVHDYEHWMLRVVDAQGAIEARGYPEELTAEIHLRIHDDVLPWNDGEWVLSVEGGQARLKRGGSGRVELDVRGLAPLYTGYLSPRELLVSPYLAGPEEDLQRLGTVFAGPAPWMADSF